MDVNIKKRRKIVSYIILSLFSLTTIYPMVWIFQNSLKTSNDVIKSSFSLPTSLFLDNFGKAMIRLNILRGYGNSLIISGVVVGAVIFFGALAAYALARHVFKGNKLVRTLVMGSLLIPVFATILPVFEMMSRLKLIDQHVGVILPQIAGNLPFTILVISSFMENIPKELEEAGVMEGCNIWHIFQKIIVPISKPAFATTAIFTFLWSYNDLFTSLIIMRTKAKMPINVLLTEISSQYGTDYGLMCAVIVLIIMPVLIFYLLAQRQIVEGMTAGAIKG
ncbi:carbohydrate ABC transporter permease [Vallitalea pronyensis]|nr:carbohydrate ABC transporter permease [Vallitalea pronyensis]